MLSQAVNSWETSLPLPPPLFPRMTASPFLPSFFHPRRTCGRWAPPIAYANFPLRPLTALSVSPVRDPEFWHGRLCSKIGRAAKIDLLFSPSLSLVLIVRLSAAKKDDPEPMLRITHSGTRARVLLPSSSAPDRPEIQIWRPTSSSKTSWRGCE